jgi:shikimate dehydrogenase
MTERFHLAGVMGWPVMHSRSPLMHGHWMAEMGLRGAYVPLAIRPGTLEPALRSLGPLGFAGVNLTIPHKQDAMAILDEVDPVARRIGAVSCVVVREDGSLFGTNNDWYGFVGNLRQNAPAWRAEAGPAAIIGAGGGGRAVCHALVKAGVPHIRLVNRTRARAEQVAADLGGPITVYDWVDRSAALEGAALVVNATSCGMVGQPPLDLDAAALPEGAVAADIVYTPLESPFLAALRRRGHQVVGGLGMLLHQGPPAWKLWFKLEPKVTPRLEELMRRDLLGEDGASSGAG